MRKLAATIFATALLLSAAQSAHAASCCMSATAFGVGRLTQWEPFALGLTTSSSYGLGAWQPDGEWRPYKDYSELTWSNELWGLFKITDWTSAYLRLPTTYNVRRAGTLRDTGGGMADISAGVRYELVSVGEYDNVPAIALSMAVVAPTGRATHRTSGPLAADATGRGAWALAGSTSIEFSLDRFFTRLDLGLTAPLPAKRPDLGVMQRYGLELNTELAGGMELTYGYVASVIIHHSWHEAITIDHNKVPNSGRRELGATVALSMQVAPNWTLQTSFDSGLFISGAGANQPGQLTGSLGLRYGYF